MTVPIEPLMRDELERRRQLYRDLFAGRPLERLAIEVRVTMPSTHSVREQFRDGDKQLEAALANVHATWEHAPSSDTVPASEMLCGYGMKLDHALLVKAVIVNCKRQECVPASQSSTIFSDQLVSSLSWLIVRGAPTNAAI
ncbi:MAG: hypothetical protein QF773_01075 [Lentisphaeria bacterium]|jgi:hypothetical protein|nr:hypothetical protein [Lentisphaeria bacterium]